MSEPTKRTYRFGPLEQRGLIGSFRRGQLVCVGTASVIAVLTLNVFSTSGGLAVALLLIGVGVGVAVVPVQGRTIEQWAPVCLRWLTRNRRFRSASVTGGVMSDLAGASTQRPVNLPPCLQGCELLGVPTADSSVGVMRDRRDGALTAVVAIRIRAVGLLPTNEHEARLARWGDVLAGMARNGLPIRRLQILQRALPADGDELWRHFLEARDSTVPEEAPLERSYVSLLEQARQATQDHEVLLAFQVDERKALARARRDARSQRLSREEQAQIVLLREVRTLLGRFDPTDVEIAGVLSPEQYVAAIRSAYDPYRHVARQANDGGVPAVVDFAPTAADIEWSSYRTDGAIHRSYWISQWPRLPVGPLFLTPLLLGSHAAHTMSLIIEPIAPARSRRDVEAAITSDEADEELRERRGFRTTARRRRQQSAAVDREEELASGHEEVRFAGFVTVSGRTSIELDEACERVEQAAQQAHLELEPLWGEQDAGFVHGALPVARGLADHHSLL